MFFLELLQFDLKWIRHDLQLISGFLFATFDDFPKGEV